MTALSQWIECPAGLPIETCNVFRRRRGLDLLDDARNTIPGSANAIVLRSDRGEKKNSAIISKILVLQGVGTEYAGLMLLLGITMGNNCTCKALMFEMNAMGVKKCREQFDSLVQKIKDNKDAWGWGKRMLSWASAGWNYAINKELRKRIDPRDPIPDLLRYAIELADRKGTGECPAEAAK